jgi:lambda family phage tail tape measure protein
MANLKYGVELDIKGAESALNSLQSSILRVSGALAGAFAIREITGISARFQDLRTSLQLLYKDAATGNAVFEDIKKLAATTSFSVDNLTETVIKLKAAGLTPTLAQLRLFSDVSSVAADSIGALQAITDLYARTTAGGLGLEDLNRLADRGIPVFNILSERLGVSRLQISKLGETAEGAAIILQALEAGLNQTFGGSTEARASNVSQAMSNFGDTVNNVFDIFGRAGYNEGVVKFLNSASEVLTLLRPLAAGIGNVLGGALEILAANVKIVTVAFVGLFTILSVSAILRIAQAFTLFNAVLGKNPIVKVLTFLAGAGAALFGISQATDEFTSQWEQLNKELDKTPNNVPGLTDGKLADGSEDLKSRIAGLNVELNRFRVEMNSVTTAFSIYNKNLIDTINLENSLIGKSKEVRDVTQAQEEIFRRAASEIQRLTEARAKLSAEELKQGRGEIIDQQIGKIRQLAEEDSKRVKTVIENTQRLDAMDKLRLFNIQQQIDFTNSLQSIQDDIAKSTMTQLEKKYYDIEAAARASAKAAIEAEQARRGSPLSTAEVEAYYAAALKGSDRLKAANRQQFEQSRTFSNGWKRAFQEYVDNATNAARQAERIFAKFTTGMEDLIVNFAKTGKFEWKDFVASMTEELLRSQVQQLIGNVMGGFGMGNLFGGGGGGSGVGATPNNPMYVIDISGGGGGIGGMGAMGGAGGGFFDSIKNIGSSIFDGISGLFGGGPEQLSGPGMGSGGGFLDSITSGIGNLFGGGGGGGGGFLDTITSGIGDFFGGFFANGGNLPAGKFGVVGERGPEFIGGPASITPMGGSVTYNINAVDASSFKALVAADPGFIHAVAMQGASSIPMRR